MKKYIINGRFLTRKTSGQERFAREITAELDNICQPGEFEIVVPKYTNDIPKYQNIKVIKYGIIKGHFWEQTNLLFYLWKNKGTGINLCTTCPLLKPDINTIHDISMSVNKQFYTNLYGRLSRIWHGMMEFSTFHFGKMVLTVSEFSKSEIVKTFKVRPESIYVLGNGWQHYERITADDEIFHKFPQLQKGKYYLAASSLTPQKNFKWIKEAAKKNPNCLLAIAGKSEKLSNKDDIKNDTNNLIYLGFVSDEEMKALMSNCKAFIHPALYEGFGITPMEALSTGAKIIISNAACLPEIYGTSAHYIDPYNTDVDLDAILLEKVDDPKKVLDKYSWKNFAERLYEYLKR